MRKSVALFVSINSFLSCQSVFSHDLPCGVHTQMQMNSSSGEWNTQVQHLNEIGEIVLLKSDCQSINQKQVSTDAERKFRLFKPLMSTQQHRF